MYTLDDLKEKIKITDLKVECPIKGCKNFVDRKRRSGNQGKNFYCKNHNIEITPSTFIYNNDSDNLLWNDKILKSINIEKTESRMKHENSEDALTWNVFRYLENKELIASYLNKITKEQHKIVDIVYWSYSIKEEKLWSYLSKARKEFGELKNRGSEPDIIIKTDKALFVIEAKFFASNRTSGYGKTLEKRINNPKKYIKGGKNLFKTIFSSDYKSIVKDQKYELMRFWLLGSWIAQELELDFKLINLVLEKREIQIETDFNKKIKSSNKREFLRVTWEDVFRFIQNTKKTDEDTTKMEDYFKNKAGGYKSNGYLKKAFDL